MSSTVPFSPLQHNDRIADEVRTRFWNQLAPHLDRALEPFKYLVSPHQLESFEKFVAQMREPSLRKTWYFDHQIKIGGSWNSVDLTLELCRETENWKGGVVMQFKASVSYPSYGILDASQALVRVALVMNVATMAANLALVWNSNLEHLIFEVTKELAAEKPADTSTT